ncbi:MAG TPA: DEAD/DEAH box helicase [Chitinophagaceae bacterium]|nr:DEAD/DEAH box helicase [Chitinophagaceae bacterium]
MSFKNLQLIEPVLNALSDEGYVNPTPIQESSIPVILQKRDLLGCAQTGTGKTAAFVIPLLQMIHQEQTSQKNNRIKALVLTPTRELAIQIGDSIRSYGKYLNVKHQVIFGGVSQYKQVHGIRQGADIIVATPGRLLDLIQQRHISLNDIQFFVLDEADRMLDMGFVHDVKRIIAKLPSKRQTLFFSATMPSEIKHLAGILLTNPETVQVDPVSSTVDTVLQQIYFVEKQNKQSLLIHLLSSSAIDTVLVFTQMKHSADRLSKSLNRAGIRSEAIHGNKNQNARQTALMNFKNKRTRVLVATDIAARGIDIDELKHVINYELPNVPETYVHRIGRTGRAGASGTAISFCDWSEKIFLKDIQKLIRKNIPAIKDHPYDISSLHTTTTPPSSGTNRTFKRNGSKRYGRTFSQRAV